MNALERTMIRREIHFPDQEPQWLVISQPEHARLSRVLAENALREFPTQISYTPSRKILSEIIYAIERHDDGWIEWETYPELDSEHKRPFAFFELSREKALPIWNKSIEVAEQIGPLAAWMVAGHFEALLHRSDDADQPDCQSWFQEMAERREQWFSTWISQHTDQQDAEVLQAFANEALAWLRIYDEISLWICSAAPIAGEVRESWPEEHEVVCDGWHSHTLAATQTILQVLSRMEAYRLTIHPWQAHTPPVLLQVRGHLIPKREYVPTVSDSPLHFGKEFIARWVLTPVDQWWEE